MLVIITILTYTKMCALVLGNDMLKEADIVFAFNTYTYFITDILAYGVNALGSHWPYAYRGGQGGFYGQDFTQPVVCTSFRLRGEK